MKNILYILFLIPFLVFPQVRGIIVGGAVAGSSVLESKPLKRISEIQKEIAMYQLAIAAEQAAVLDLENKMYKGISKKENFIKGLNIIIKIAESQENIFKWLEKTKKIVGDSDELKKAFNKNKLLYVFKSGVFINDIIIATKEDKTNLINNKQRFEILHKILDNIKIVESEVINLYLAFNTIQKIQALDIKASETDFSGLLKNLEKNFYKIFPKDLNKE